MGTAEEAGALARRLVSLCFEADTPEGEEALGLALAEIEDECGYDERMLIMEILARAVRNSYVDIKEFGMHVVRALAEQQDQS